MTMCCWAVLRNIYVNVNTVQCMMAIGNSALSTTRVQLDIISAGNANNELVRGIITTNVVQLTMETVRTSAEVLGGFNHYCLTWDGTINADAGRFYFNGIERDTTPLGAGTCNGWDLLSIGHRRSAGVDGGFFSGIIAEAAMWNINLNANEVLAISQGINPLNIRPTKLKFYAPLWGRYENEIDIIGGRTLTLTP